MIEEVTRLFRAAGVKRFISGVLFAGAALAFGADWLAPRGDTQNSGWQRDEKVLNTRTVRRLRLLWQRKLSETPHSITDPIILGPIITHRGIKELVFVQNAVGSVYAIDADLGRIFWNRSLGSPSACAGGRPIQPTMRATPASDVGEKSSDSDNFSDGNRPLYALTANGTVFALRPSTGNDFATPFRFLPPDIFPVHMQALENTLDAMTSLTCGGVVNASWSIPVSAAGVPAGRASATESGITELFVEFPWKEKLWQVTADQNGQPRLRPAIEAKRNTANTAGELATWEDAEGRRWVCVTARGELSAFQVRDGKSAVPVLLPKWRRSNLVDPGAPVVANGILYFLARTAIDGPVVLRAVNALTGEELYSSKELVLSGKPSWNLAVANAHVCFSATDSQTFCFGLPFEL